MRFLLPALALLLTTGAIWADVLPPQTFMVSMRDGIRLATDVYLPSRNGSFPVLVERTTYDKDVEIDLDPFIRHDYGLVLQSTRGRFASEGVDRIFFDDGWGENQDGYDTIEWVAAQSFCNGHIGGFGQSVKGISQYLIAGSFPPVLDCGAPVISGRSTGMKSLAHAGMSASSPSRRRGRGTSAGSYMSPKGAGGAMG